MLAINRFAYGPLIFVNGQANVQIGKLICYGTKPFLYILAMRSHLIFFYGLSGSTFKKDMGSNNFNTRTIA